MTALPSLHRQRPGEALLAQTRPHLISFITLTEMEVSRRVVEAPQVSLKPEERNCLLAEQGEYLCLLYGALARQIGESAALAEFEWLLLSVGRARWRLRMPYKTLREGQPLLAAPATVLAHAPKDAAALLAAP